MNKYLSQASLMIALIVLSVTARASDLSIPNTFTAGQAAVAAEVNDNFTATETAVDDNNTRITSLENNAVGIEFVQTDSTENITSTVSSNPTTVLTLDFTAPGPGFIRISFNTWLRYAHQSGVQNYVVCTINTPDIALPGSRMFDQIVNSQPTGTYYRNQTTQGVFEVTAAGTVTIQGRCFHNVAATNAQVDSRSLIATFHANRY